MERLGALFRFDGRAGRLEYWRTQIGLLFGSAAVVLAAIFLTNGGAPLWLTWFTAIPALALLWMAVAVICRRLHDRGKGAWWLAPFQFGPWLMLGSADALNTFFPADSMLGLLLVLVLCLGALALSIWAVVEIGFLPGARSANRFGPAS